MIMQVPKGKPMKQRLVETGFDKSVYNRETKSWKVGCSCCNPLVINGVPCHELNCKNLKKVKNEKGRKKK